MDKMKKLKRITSLILSACLLLTAIYIPYDCFAEITSGTCGENAFWEYDDSTGTLTISGTGNMDDYVYSQTKDTSVFRDYRETAKNVIIGEGITRVGNYTFWYFTNIENVTFPSTLISVGLSSFYGCEKISKIMLPETVTTIEQSAFSNTNVKSFCSEKEGEAIIGDNIINLGDGCLGSSKYITSLYIGKNIVSKYRTTYSYDLTSIITYSNLKEITLSPENSDLTLIDNVLYSKDLSTLVLYPKGKTDTDYVIPDGTTTLFSCFRENTYIKNVIIPDSVTKINKMAFFNCTNLETVRLSESITTIPSGCFQDCYKLNNVVLPSKITSIESNAFMSCISLSDISLNEGIKTIGLSAFMWCEALKSIKLPSTLTTLSSSSFSACRRLEKINIPPQVTTIPSDCLSIGFGYIGAGLTIDFEGDIKVIESSAFYETTFADPLVFPESITDIKSPTKAYVDRIFVLSKDCNIANGTFLKCDSTLIGYKNSTLEEYANNNSLNFVEICSSKESHIYQEVGKHEPTCTEKGYTTFRCKICGSEYNDDYVAESSHTEVVDDAVEPDCTHTGLTEGSHCSVCNEILTPQTTVDPLDHSYTKEVIAPTCSQQGYTEYTCERCGDSYKDDFTDTTAHSFTYYVSDGNATCTKDGTKTASCDRCSATDTVTDFGSMLPHTCVWRIASPATENQEGVEEYYCTVCNTVIETRAIPVLEPIEENEAPLELIEDKEIVIDATSNLTTPYDDFRVVSGLGCAKVAWSTDEGVDGYLVYTSSSPDEDFELVGAVENNEADFCVIQNLARSSIMYIRIVAYKTENDKLIQYPENKTKKVFIK